MTSERQARPPSGRVPRSRALSVALVALALLPGGAAAQSLDFLTDLFDGVRAVAISFNFVQLNGSGALESDGSCPISEACGGQAEVLLGLDAIDGPYQVELGLSASYLRGFRAVSDQLDLRGATRSFPTIAVYVSRELGEEGKWSPYAGLSFGLSDLWNARAYDGAGAVYSLDGQTFDWGVILALAYDIGPGWVFAESTYTWRTFSSLDWTLPTSAAGVLPSAFPRALEFSGTRVNVGFQFQVKADPPLTSS